MNISRRRGRSPRTSLKRMSASRAGRMLRNRFSGVGRRLMIGRCKLRPCLEGDALDTHMSLDAGFGGDVGKTSAAHYA